MAQLNEQQQKYNTKLWIKGVIIDLQNYLARKEFNNKKLLIVPINQNTALREETTNSTVEERRNCLITDLEINQLLETIQELANDLNIKSANNTTYFGIINQINQSNNCQDLYYIKQELEQQYNI